MKARYATLLVIVATFAAVLTSNAADSQRGGIPLVVGQFSFNAQGTVGLCFFDPSTFTLEPCLTSGVLVVSAMGTDNGAVTWDNDHSCASYTNVQSLLPLGASPPMVTPNFTLVTTLVDYDPRTGTGDNTFTTYVGGKCNGATFDKSGPPRAKEFSTGTEHFVVSGGGNRLDFVLKTLMVPPDAAPSTNQIGSFSFTGTELKQTSQY
ncbi:MAG TPA: hypothetical protein VJY34_24865 [Roseiarcus sp.]|nr:hypothetical protein [Roseiarcus sp.]